MTTPVKFVRIYLTEGDKDCNENLYKELFKLLHDNHRVRGVTVFRGIAGFGSKGEVHSSDLLRLNVSLPLVIEFFDDPGVVDPALVDVAEHISPRHIVSWMAQCG